MSDFFIEKSILFVQNKQFLSSVTNILKRDWEDLIFLIVIDGQKEMLELKTVIKYL